MTVYYVILRWRSSGKEQRMEFSSMTSRELAIIGYGAFADVVERGLSNASSNGALPSVTA